MATQKIRKNIGDQSSCGCAALLALSCAVIAAPTYAQQPPDAGRLLEQMRDKVPAPQPQRDVMPAEPVRPAMSGQPGLRVTVKSFRILGNTRFSEAELLETVQEFVGKELDFNGLNEAATKVRSYYRSRGYFLAQAYLPVQKIESGVVEIAVIEGRLGEIKINQAPESRLSPRLAQGIINSELKSGQLITETGLERPLLVLSDLPGTQVTSEIAPSKTPGAADLTVKLGEQGRLVSGSAELDNHGNRFTGEFRASLALTLNNPLGQGDLLSASGITTSERFNFGRVAYVIPVWYYGTRIGLSYAAFDYRLSKDFASLEANGDGTVSAIYALHPVIRTRNANLIVQVAYEKKELEDRVDSQSRLEQRDISSARIGAIGDFRDGMLGGGLNSYSVTYTDGKVDIRPDTVLTTDQGPAGLKTQGRFNKWNFEYRRLQRLTDNMNMLFALTGQVASKNLTSAEKFSLGGPLGVRAYPVGEAPGDTGYQFTTELRYIIPNFKVWGGDMTVLGFYDQGGVRTDKNPLPTNSTNERNIAGYGIGASLGADGNFIIRASAAWRAEHETAVSDGAKRTPRVWIQAVKWF